MAQVEPEGRDALRAKLLKELLDLGMDEWDAQLAVGLYLGETLGDVVADPPLTKEEYRRMGLNRDFLFDRTPDLAMPVEDVKPKRRRP
jgi:hypothetical protein